MDLALQRGDVDYLNKVALDVLLNYRDADGNSALSKAIWYNHLDCCQVIYSRCPSLIYSRGKHKSIPLHQAAYHGNPDTLKFIISAGADSDPENKLLSILDINNTPALNMAVDGGNLEAVKLLIEADPKMLGMVNSYGYSPMHIAVRNRNLEMVKLLLEANPDIKYYADYMGNIPLLMATKQAQSDGNTSASAEIRKLLLKKQPSQGKTPSGHKGWTPLHHASHNGDLSAIEDIIRFCPGSWEEVDNEGKNFLHIAAMFGIFKVVKYTLEIKEIDASVLNKQDEEGNTPLHVAALNGHESTALCLLYDLRVDKTTVNKEGKYILDSITFNYDKRKAGVYGVMEHVQRGDREYFRVVALDVLLDSRDENNDSVLSKAVMENQLDCCEEIYRRCPSLLYSQSNEEYTALHHAAHRGKLKMLEFLISVGAKTYFANKEEAVETIPNNKLLTMVDGHGATALHSAVNGVQLDAVKLLIEADSNKELLRMVTKKKATALHWAVEKQNLEIVKFLVDTDTDMEYCADISGETPLLMAMRQAQLGGNTGASAKTKKFLLKTQPNQGKALIGDNEWTPLHYAAYKGDLNSIEDIIRFCPGCWEEVDNKKRNFLHIAVMFEHVKVVKFVLGTKEIAATVLNGQDQDEKTPLHVAALSGNERMTLCLLYDPRVNKTTMSSEGQNVLDSITFDYDKRKAGVYGVSDILDQKDLKDQSDFDLVVGALIATVSFTAGITVPGGYNSDGPDKGMAVLSKKISFEAFVVSNNLALIFSLYAVFCHFCTRRLLKKEDIIYQLSVATFCTVGAIFAMMVAFITGSYAVLANSNRSSIIVCINSSCFFIFACRPMWKVLMQDKHGKWWFYLCSKEKDKDSTNKSVSEYEENSNEANQV